jgi:hypothetical protein
MESYRSNITSLLYKCYNINLPEETTANARESSVFIDKLTQRDNRKMPRAMEEKQKNKTPSALTKDIISLWVLGLSMSGEKA